MIKSRRRRKKTCPNCGNEMDYRAKQCKSCYIGRGRKKEKPKVKWQERLLGNTQFPTAGDPVGLCEICGERERTPDSWYCQECIGAVDEMYANRVTAKKLQREEKKGLMLAA